MQAEGQAKEHQIHQLQDEMAINQDYMSQLMVSNLSTSGNDVTELLQKCVEELEAEGLAMKYQIQQLQNEIATTEDDRRQLVVSNLRM